MDSSKQKAQSSSSSSSIALELFGPKETPQSVAAAASLASSSSIFGSVFGPSSTGMGGTGNQGWNVNNGGPNHGINAKGYQQESNQPWHYSSSIYYGGQEVYSTSSVDTKPQYKKDGQDDEPDSSHVLGAASRGNWWQGSLYY